jgi:hypothetical protein
MAAPTRTIPPPPRTLSRWTEWLIILSVVAITAIGAFTVLGGDVQGWWRGDGATPGDTGGPGQKHGPGSGPPAGPQGPAGPSGPAIGI